jgi:hypothetical protein
MKLADVTLPVDLEWARAHCLAFTPQLAARLSELHASFGGSNLILIPRALTDGRLVLSADVLTEVMPGGLLNAMWEAADKQALGQAVEVLPWSEAVALLPPDPVV